MCLKIFFNCKYREYLKKTPNKLKYLKSKGVFIIEKKILFLVGLPNTNFFIFGFWLFIFNDLNFSNWLEIKFDIIKFAICPESWPACELKTKKFLKCASHFFSRKNFFSLLKLGTKAVKIILLLPIFLLFNFLHVTLWFLFSVHQLLYINLGTIIFQNIIFGIIVPTTS